MDLMALHQIILLMHHLCFMFIYHIYLLICCYCFTPKSFCISTMIPIPKGSNKDTSDLRNYRGIALSSLLSKLFYSCIISLNTVVFKSDDLQFAYKKSCSTIQCVSMVTEVIDYSKQWQPCLYVYARCIQGF